MIGRIVCCCVCLLLCFNSMPAQDTYEDVVYLRNGGIMHGLVLEQIPGQSVKIQTADRNVFVFAFDQIERITKEIKPSSSFGIPVIENQSAGYSNLTRLGLISGEGSNIFSISTIHGVQLGEHFSTGIGTGLDAYPTETMIPLFLDIRGYLPNGRISPLVFADVGYSFGKQNGHRTWDAGGLIVNAGAGLRMSVAPDVSFVVEVSYRLQDSKLSYSGYDFFYFPYSYDAKVRHELVTVMAGFGF